MRITKILIIFVFFSLVASGSFGAATDSRTVPASIPGLGFWYDADDAGTLITSGSGITEWKDKSPNKYHASILADAFKPVVEVNGLNNRNTVKANGKFIAATNADYTGLTGNAGMTMYVVYRIDNDNLFPYIGALTGQNGFSFQLLFNGGNIYFEARNELEEEASASFPSTTGQYRLNVLSFDGSIIKLQDTDTSDTAPLSGVIFKQEGEIDIYPLLSQSPSNTIYLAEEIYFNRKLEDFEDVQIRDYIYKKWGLY